MEKKVSDNQINFPKLGRALLWIDNKKNIDLIPYALYFLCTILFISDFVYHKHVNIGVEKIPGFYALYGFCISVFLVVCAKAIRVFLKRPEDYYAPYDVESETMPEEHLERVDSI